MAEVKWALESITTNKASAGDRIPVELFQILEDDAVKVQTPFPSSPAQTSSSTTGRGMQGEMPFFRGVTRLIFLS